MLTNNKGLNVDLTAFKPFLYVYMNCYFLIIFLEIVKKSMIASSITEAIEINVCHPFNLRDPSQTLSIKKLKGIYFKAF